MSFIDVIKDQARKIGTAGQKWIADRELDQKRLDWLDANPHEIQYVHARCQNEDGDGTAREAVDFFMAKRAEAKVSEGPNDRR